MYHSIQTSCQYAFSLYIKISSLLHKGSTNISVLKMESLYSKRLRTTAREDEVISEKLCWKMLLSDLEAGVVKQKQEKTQKVEPVRFRKTTEELTKGEEVVITPSLYIWPMGTTVVPLIIMRFCCGHDDPEM